MPNPKTKASPKATRKTKTPKAKPVTETIEMYWSDKDQRSLLKTRKFLYEAYFYFGNNHRFQLLDVKTFESDSEKETTQSSRIEGGYEVKSVTLIGAPLIWLDKNGYIKQE